MRKLILFLAIVSAVTAAEERDAGISNKFLNQRIAAKKYASIHDVDFRNSPILQLTDPDDKKYWATLTNGGFSRDYKRGGGDDIELESVRYLRADTGNELALVRLRWVSVGGSSSPSGLVMVIGLDGDGFPIIRQRIEYNVRGADQEEAWARFDPANNQLRVSAVHSWEHCCPRERIVITFHWNGEKFVPIGRRVLPLRHPNP